MTDTDRRFEKGLHGMTKKQRNKYQKQMHADMMSDTEIAQSARQFEREVARIKRKYEKA